jgi:aarF domain-containing kinase
MLRIAKVVGGATILTSAYVVTSSDRRYATSQAVSATGRITSLVSTVALIATDYKLTLADIEFNKSSKQTLEDQIAMKKNELDELASEQEKMTIISLTTNDPLEREAADKRIKQTRQTMDLAAAQIARLNTQENNGKLKRCHSRNAIRLKDMCAKNRGVYIKLGQHLAMLDYMLPEEYTNTLSTLLAQTPRSSWEDVEAVLCEDLRDAGSSGVTSTDGLFDSIEHEPIASASLAQVHIAYKDGKKLAVKVQHRGLREESIYDMLAITKCIDFISYLFPDDFQYQWLTREMNTNLPLELNFETEIHNSIQAKENLHKFILSGDLVIPEVHKALSNSRVITMDYEEGCYVNDVNTIKNMGLRTADVAKLVSTTFCEQIYRHGFVHCDPHEGNVLVRPHTKNANRPCIVLLDHGLYKKLDDNFRLDYCNLWSSLILGDKDAIKAACVHLKVGPAYTLLSAILTMRPWDDIVNKDRSKVESGKLSASDAQMLQIYAQKYFKDIVQLLGRVDSDMLLLLKTNDCLRHLDRKLGTPVNTTKIVGDITSNVLVMEELWPSIRSPRKKNQEGKGFEGYQRENFSEVYKVAAEYNAKELVANQQQASNSNDVDTRPGGIMYWLHPRTQRALWNYSMMQIRGVQLTVVDWYMWFKS